MEGKEPPVIFWRDSPKYAHQLPRSIYIIGSLRNPQVPLVSAALRKAGLDVFDDWWAVGPQADDYWRDYEKARGRSYREALQGYSARHTFDFDLAHLKRCDMALLVLPAGRSGHLELGMVLGWGKPGFILLDNPDRWDVMYQAASAIYSSIDEMVEGVRGYGL